MQQYSPREIYHQQLQNHKTHLQLLLKKRSRIGWARLIAFLLTIIISYQIFVGYGIAGSAIVVIGLSFLLYLISIDVANNQNIANTKTLIQVNDEELKILDNHYHTRFDGAAFMPAIHDYANDIDLFGNAS